MPLGSAHLLQTVAGNVKRQRARHGWSQQELAERSQVSRGMIAKIESGAENVSLATLGRIALAFGISFTDVVSAAGPEGAGLAGAPVQVWQGPRPGSRVALLGSFVGQRMTDLFEWTLAPGDRYVGEPDLARTRELVYVVKGALTLEHADGSPTLKAGQALGFPSDRPYALVNAGRGELRFILAVVG